VRLEGNQHVVNAGKAESGEKINAQRSENGLLRGVALNENAAEDNDHNEDVERETENNAYKRKCARIGARQENPLQEGRNGQRQRKPHEAASKTHCVDAQHRDGATEHSKSQVRKAGVSRIGIKDEVSQQNQEQRRELALCDVPST